MKFFFKVYNFQNFYPIYILFLYYEKKEACISPYAAM